MYRIFKTHINNLLYTIKKNIGSKSAKDINTVPCIL